LISYELADCLILRPHDAGNLEATLHVREQGILLARHRDLRGDLIIRCRQELKLVAFGFRLDSFRRCWALDYRFAVSPCRSDCEPHGGSSHVARLIRGEAAFADRPHCSLISREDQVPAREGRHNNNNNNDDISSQPVLSDARAGGGQGVSFQASPLGLRYGARVKLHPPVRKGCMPIRLHRKCGKNPIKSNCRAILSLVHLLADGLMRAN
jgi:hypothetical protein